MKSISIGDRPLSLEEVREVADGKARARVSERARSKMTRSYRYLQKKIESGESIYGVNTGFGSLSQVSVPSEKISELQHNLLRSHAVGTGDPLPERAVRAMLLLRAHALAQGFSGVRVLVAEKVLEILNRGVVPMIPEQGSVGASGDLSPLAHLSLVLIGEGEAFYRGKRMSGARALRAAGIKPIALGPKEGLALINGTQLMTAIGTLALLEAEHLADLADLAGAMSVEALRGTASAFAPEIQSVRPHPGQKRAAARMRALLGGGRKSEIARSHENCGKVQDPYSLRCIPQVHGASRDLMAFVRGVLEREANSVTDNPLVFSGSNMILSGGNFHGEVVAMAMDALCIAVAELASISEQRQEKLVSAHMSELPPFLAPQGGVNSGFMLVQVAAASIVSENKTLCHPASVDSIPTSADKEDHVSMGAWAARKAHRVVENTRRVLAMEILTASQGLDFLSPLKSTSKIQRAHALVRSKIPFMEKDRYLHADIARVESMIVAGKFTEIVRV